MSAKREADKKVFRGPKESAKLPPMIPPAKFPNPIDEFSIPTPLPLSFSEVKSEAADVEPVMNRA